MKVLPQWWRTHFLCVEFCLALALAAFVALWLELCGTRTLDQTLDGNRAQLYSALSSIFGALLGFVITALSIVLGFSNSESLRVVRDSPHYPTLWRVFSAANRSLGLATVIALLGLLLDRDGRPAHALVYATLFTGTLASFRLARCVWVLERVMRLVAGPRAT